MVKIRTISKKASNKSFSASNFGQKSFERAYVYLPPKRSSGARKMIGWNIKFYRKRKIHSLLGWTLPKIRNISKKASNKSFSASNFGQKSPWQHMSISRPPPSLSGAKGLERWYGWNINHIIFRGPYIQWGRDVDICPHGLLYLKFDAEKLLFEAFFGIICILGSIQPKSKCIFPFLHNSIFQPYHLSSFLTPLWGVADICPCGLFLSKIRYRKTFIWSFFWNIAFFRQCSSQSECIFPFLYNLIFHLNTGDNHMLSLVAIKNGVCPQSGCSRALICPGESDRIRFVSITHF